MRVSVKKKMHHRAYQKFTFILKWTQFRSRYREIMSCGQTAFEFGRYTDYDSLPFLHSKVLSDGQFGCRREWNLKDRREVIKKEFGIESMIKCRFLLRSVSVKCQSAFQIPAEPIKVGSVMAPLIPFIIIYLCSSCK